VPDKDFELKVWNDQQPKSVKLYNHFNPINESSCKMSIRLAPDEYTTDAFNILANGSLHFINSDQPLLKSSEYCMVKNKNVTNF
jgi:Methuselah N-terminus